MPNTVLDVFTYWIYLFTEGAQWTRLQSRNNLISFKHSLSEIWQYQIPIFPSHLQLLNQSQFQVWQSPDQTKTKLQTQVRFKSAWIPPGFPVPICNPHEDQLCLTAWAAPVIVQYPSLFIWASWQPYNEPSLTRRRWAINSQQSFWETRHFGCCNHIGHHPVALVVIGCLLLHFPLGQLMCCGVMSF